MKSTSRTLSRSVLNRCILTSLLLIASQLHAAVLRVGPGEPYTRISDAAAAARDGDIVEIQPGEYRGDVAIWSQRQLTIRGLGAKPGQRPLLLADGKSAEDKAIWVMRQGDITVSNIEFRGSRVADGTGAGIRLEHGRLTLENCVFIDNQMGLLTSNFEDAELIIRNSLFAQAPHQEGTLPHLLYVGRIKRFEISGSRFHQGYRGHLIKSRARINDIRYNLIHDGPQGEASYEIDLPNGGHSVLIGNIVGQSARTQNPVVISYGAEGPAWPNSALYLAHNTLLSERLTGTWFLRTHGNKLPANLEVYGINNLTVGLGTFTLTSQGEFRGNVPLPPGGLMDPATLDFRPRAPDLLRGLTQPAGRLGELELTPTQQFSLPIGSQPLSPGIQWLPGAVQ